MIAKGVSGISERSLVKGVNVASEVTAQMIVKLLLVAPPGSYVVFDELDNCLVLVLEGGMTGRERASRSIRAEVERS